MASVNFKKCKSAGEAKAMMRHSEKQERMKHEHSNPDIDKSLTQQNTSLYGLSYQDMCQKYDERIRVLDETTNTNKRSDRVTMFSLEFSVPEGLPVWLENEYLADCEKVIAQQYGEHNIIESERHLDEKHRYVDHGVEKMSRAHGHTFVVPEIDGKLNGKKFSSKSQMMKLNQSIDKMSVQKYHVHFMTGKEARHQTVEEMKRESAIEQQNLSIAKNNEILQRQYEVSQGLKDEQARLEAEYAEKKKLIAAREADLEKKEKRLTQKENRLAGRELEPKELKALENKTFWTPDEKQNVLKTAKLSARNAHKAEEAELSKNQAISQLNALESENEALRGQIPSVAKQLHYNAQDDRIASLKEQVKELRQDIKVRDRFIQQQGLKEKFKEFCREIGHKLKVAIEDISRSNERR